jgi:2-dehydro-3-deoxyphosphogluconate aldolase / (4S)-4-hydroxy-2-oxoglutarate aldolase
MSIPPIFEILEATGVLAVLVIDDAADAVPVAEALLAGGVNAMELTLRTDAAVAALKAIRKSVPDMLVGIGTILMPEQVREVVAEGAAFGVSPGINPKVVEAAIESGLPFAPGIATPSEVEMALSFGCRRLKFFPAESLGGLGYLRAMSPPYHHLGVKYVPLGGVGPKNLAEYIADPLVAAVGGSWFAPRDKIAAKDWRSIEQNAREARGIIDQARTQS